MWDHSTPEPRTVAGAPPGGRAADRSTGEARPGPGKSVAELLEASPDYSPILRGLRERPRRWLVTGAAGFIGSNLTEVLLRHGQEVVGLDDLSTGYRENLVDVETRVDASSWSRFRFVRGDVADVDAVATATRGVDVVLHHAAFVSVPASIRDPIGAHHANATGFLHVLNAASEAGAKRVVYAASSASYGDDDAPVKLEGRLGRPLSMYAATKTANELYAAVFARTAGLDSVGLRYFNIFGPRQDPGGAYAAVIPKWIAALAAGERCTIFGDGETTRDFCHVANVVGANLLAASSDDASALNEVYNIGTGGSTTLNELFTAIRDALARALPDRADLRDAEPDHGPFREGDVRHSRADVSKAREVLGYRPVLDVHRGIDHTIERYLATAQLVG